jgi:tetratricopeptide (TPR) repeat protein
LLLAGLLVVGLGLTLFVRQRLMPPDEPPELPIADPAEFRLTIPPRPEFDDPADPDAEQRRVIELRNESFELAERLLSTLPDDPFAICLLATVHRRHANPQAAIPLLEYCLGEHPQCADASHSLGLIALHAGDFAEAETRLVAARTIDPVWHEIPRPLSEALIQQGKLTEAVEVLERYLAEWPASAEGWSRLGQAHQQLEDYAEAKRCYQQAVELAPNDPDAWYGAGMALQKLGEADSAREHLETFARLRTEKVGRIKAERDAWTDESRMQTTVIKTAMTAGEVYARRGRLQEAEACWKRVASLDPEHQPCRELLCRLYAEQKLFREAIRIRGELCELQPDEPGHWLSLGKLRIQNGQPKQAEKPFRRVIELAPGLADGYAAMAEIEMLPDRDHAEAVALAEKAVELAPTAANHFVLAAACWNVGDGPKARSAIEQAVRLDPEDPRYREAALRLQPRP